MKVLVACEESQVVCKAFRARGHEAYSCDTQDCSGGHPEWHIKDDVLKHLDDGWDLAICHPPCTYLCVTGNKWMKPEYADRFPKRHQQREEAVKFFMSLANAPVERIAVENPICIMSSRWRQPDQIIQPWMFGDAHVKKTCLWLKNLPLLRYGSGGKMMFGEQEPPPSTEIVEPEYVIYKSTTKKSGHSKYPLLWSSQGMPEQDKVKLTKMPLLWKESPSEERQKARSVTYQGIAEAMAEQWG